MRRGLWTSSALPEFSTLSPDMDRIHRILQWANNRKSGQPSGAGISGGDFFYVDGQTPELPLYFYVMAVAA